MIWKFQPFAIDKTKFGEEINTHCSIVPNSNDWILILDWDCMILTPKSYSVIERAIENNPDVEVFGAMTNRVGLSFQRLGKEPDDNDSIRYHIQMAEELANKYHNGECKPCNQVAGFFMLFRKSYWEQNRFQEAVMDKRGNLFDYTFTRPAGRTGKAKIIQGVYVFHQYRLMKDYRDKTHLMNGNNQ